LNRFIPPAATEGKISVATCQLDWIWGNNVNQPISSTIGAVQIGEGLLLPATCAPFGFGEYPLPLQCGSTIFPVMYWSQMEFNACPMFH
jgi:hypothetical protein